MSEAVWHNFVDPSRTNTCKIFPHQTCAPVFDELNTWGNTFLQQPELWMYHLDRSLHASKPKKHNLDADTNTNKQSTTVSPLHYRNVRRNIRCKHHMKVAVHCIYGKQSRQQPKYVVGLMCLHDVGHAVTEGPVITQSKLG